MKLKLGKFLNNIINKVLQKFTNAKPTDRRALLVLFIVGIIVGVFYWFNATLVYDDIAFPSNFSGLVDRIGWFKSLIKIFTLDLPNEYRTYGISRVIQFLIWSTGGSSVAVYTIFISLSQIITTLVLYTLLIKIKIERIIALSMGLMWTLSPFIWTSCFHHYSYLILPIQITIIGSYFLITINNPKKLTLFSILLGFIIALTGELHLLAVPFILIAIAIASGKKIVLRRSFLVILSMVTTVSIHYLTWKTFAANSIQSQRFSINLSHDINFWAYRFFVAIRGIGRSILEQIGDIINHNFILFIIISLISSILVYAGFTWFINQYNKKTNEEDENTKHSSLRLALVLFISSFIYLTTFILVVVISDSVPSSMPRRYGYIPLTILFSSLVIFLYTLCTKPLHKKIMLSVLIGALTSLFVIHQTIIIPNTRLADDKLSEMIKSAIKENPSKIVLFFSSSEKIFPLTSIDTSALGPAMSDFTRAEVTQAKYGTYWPAYINITKVLGAPYTCLLGGVKNYSEINLICPPWQENPGIIDDSKTIIVANLGFDKYDPFGKQVRVFKNYREFEPYFFSKQIIKDINWAEPLLNDTVAIDLGTISSKVAFDYIFPDKHFNDPILMTSKKWLINYGLIKGDDSIYSLPNDSINSDYYRSNRNGSFSYAFKFSESDVDINLDFWELWNKKPKERLFDIQVSWNDEEWVSLGEIDPALINGNKPFSIKLSHQNTRSFSFKLLPVTGTKDIPFIQGIRITKR